MVFLSSFLLKLINELVENSIKEIFSTSLFVHEYLKNFSRSVAKKSKRLIAATFHPKPAAVILGINF